MDIWIIQDKENTAKFIVNIYLYCTVLEMIQAGLKI